MRPYFTIIIPNYNNGEWIEGCINSVLEQTFQDFQLIIVDDCSTDNSKELIAKYDSKFENIHAVFLEEKRFNGGSRNAGYDYASKSGFLGEYVLFLDSDDKYKDSEVLQDIYDLIVSNNNPDCVRLSYEAVRPERVIPVILQETSPQALVNDVNCATWLKVIKSEKWVHQVENSLMEDAIHNYMQCDVIDTVVPIKRICISWNRLNTNSCSTHPELQNGKWKSSMYRYVADLMDNVPKHDYCLRERNARLTAAERNVKLGRVTQDK